MCHVEFCLGVFLMCGVCAVNAPEPGRSQPFSAATDNDNDNDDDNDNQDVDAVYGNGTYDAQTTNGFGAQSTSKTASPLSQRENVRGMGSGPLMQKVSSASLSEQDAVTLLEVS